MNQCEHTYKDAVIGDIPIIVSYDKVNSCPLCNALYDLGIAKNKNEKAEKIKQQEKTKMQYQIDSLKEDKQLLSEQRQELSLKVDDLLKELQEKNMEIAKLKTADKKKNSTNLQEYIKSLEEGIKCLNSWNTNLMNLAMKSKDAFISKDEKIPVLLDSFSIAELKELRQIVGPKSTNTLMEKYGFTEEQCNRIFSLYSKAKEELDYCNSIRFEGIVPDDLKLINKILNKLGENNESCINRRNNEKTIYKS